jgi:hypothetical protein
MPTCNVEYQKTPMEKMHSWSDTMRRVSIPGFKVAEYAKQLLQEEREINRNSKKVAREEILALLLQNGHEDAASFLKQVFK